ncbi:MAG: hypothetical protein EBZ48_13555 [Proteobacteria bacterium]|nr:hypothetical protein [Pseudomonadota bacterium]
MTDDFSFGTVAYEHANLPWLPAGALLQCTLTDTPPPLELVTGVFGLCFLGEQLLLVGHSNRRDGPPGGHRDGEETLEQNLSREVYEEACVLIQEPKIIAAMKVTLPAPKPANYRYPFPVSYMVAYAAKVTEVETFISRQRGIFLILRKQG